MDPEMTIEQVDVDGAIRETAHEAAEALDSGDTRLSFLKKAGLAGGAVIGGGALLGALTPAGAMAASRQGAPAGQIRQGRRRHPQLRPHPGVPGGRLLQRGDRQPEEEDVHQGQAGPGLPEDGDRGRERPRRLPQEGAGQQGRRRAESRLRRHHLERSVLRQDGGRAGEHRRPRLLGAGAEHRQPRLRRRGALDPHDRGTARIGRRAVALRQAVRDSPPTVRSTRPSLPPKSSRQSKGPASSSRPSRRRRGRHAGSAGQSHQTQTST